MKFLKNIRFRHVYMTIGGVLILLLMLGTDPTTGLVRQLPFGGPTLDQLQSLWKMVLYVGMLHVSLRALFDYIDKQKLFDKAMETSQGAGLALIALGLFALAIAVLSIAALMN